MGKSIRERARAGARLGPTLLLALCAGACDGGDPDDGGSAGTGSARAGSLPLGSACQDSSECRQGRCERPSGSGSPVCFARCSEGCPEATFCDVRLPDLDRCTDPCEFGVVNPRFVGGCVEGVFTECEALTDRGPHCTACGCPDGEACFRADTGPGTECRTAPRDGEACEVDAQCAEGVCETLTGADGSEQLQVCVVPREAGAECQTDRSCSSGVCVSGSCSVPLGDACDETTPCARCVDHVSPAFCSDTCTDASGCSLEGWTCVNVQGDGRSCYPNCTEQAQCAQDFTCTQVGDGRLPHGVCMAGEEAARFPFR